MYNHDDANVNKSESPVLVVVLLPFRYKKTIEMLNIANTRTHSTELSRSNTGLERRRTCDDAARRSIIEMSKIREQ